MQENIIKINLEDYKQGKSKLFAKRDYGNEVRNNLNLTKLEQDYDIIEIEIPYSTLSVNTSFFLGLFEESINTLGVENFKEKYRFNCSEIVKISIKGNLDRMQRKVLYYNN